ncbi:hypothetical protein RKE29_02640 [Streptomyces sp. B1866]|uniref:hypothetical protein n=1 Tax=Streptomyces sp. B1866 TaxID=3075431 RepID=UPI00288F07B1|nr:hypothetical protein [Streptomyces sp. B1866]MDT3395556.1 hypothetical protein [Streptomyces sp. B1866]
MATVSPQEPSSAPSDPTALVDPDYDEALRGLVVDTAPRLFAVVREYGEADERDAEVAAWGLAHDDGSADVTTCPEDGPAIRLRLRSPERAVWWFARPAGVSARLVWLEPSADAGFVRPAAA